MPNKSNLIGSRFGDKLQLEVIEKNKGKGTYTVKCHICATDPELFGEALYKISCSRLKAGNLPCGCSKRPVLTKEQHVIRCSRKCKENNFKFITFEEDWKGIDTKLKVKCLKDEHEWWISVDNLMRDKGCPKCRSAIISNNFKYKIFS